MPFRVQLTADQVRLPVCQEAVTLGCSDKK
jgi:hypothetical protein